MATAVVEPSSGQRPSVDWLPFILPVVLGLAWTLVSYTHTVPDYVLPSPSKLAITAADFVTGLWKVGPYSGTFVRHMLASLQRVALGFALATVLGVPLGLLTGCSQVAQRILDFTVHSIRAVPGIGWLPIAMVWFGIGTPTTVFLIALAAFFPTYVNAALGARSVRPLWIRAAQMLGASRRELFLTVILPAALPAIADGSRLSLGISWAYLVLGELTGMPDGLGAVMMDARMMGYPEIILVSMLFIAILGRISDLALIGVFRRLLPPQAA